ncbi:MAG: type II toxin-antitoxin system MqsA family antitoxin [Clostridiales bacterium]|nr:type II toxin-antitoxin system MqsA family antitoxin [Clostridiales bacterium]
MCNFCFDDNKIKTKTTFTVEYKDCIIVIKNVPCLECQMCGEITFTDDVSAKLEKIVETAKKIMQEISVIDYTKAA